MTRVDYLREALDRLDKIRRYLRGNAGAGLRGGLGYHLDELEQDLAQLRLERHELRRDLEMAALERDQARAQRDELRRQWERRAS